MRREKRYPYLVTIVFSISLVLSSMNEELGENCLAYATASSNDVGEDEEVTLNPILKNNLDLKVEEVSDGLNFPTSMAFLGPDDILVLEKK